MYVKSNKLDEAIELSKYFLDEKTSNGGYLFPYTVKVLKEHLNDDGNKLIREINLMQESKNLSKKQDLYEYFSNLNTLLL